MPTARKKQKKNQRLEYLQNGINIDQEINNLPFLQHLKNIEKIQKRYNRNFTNTGKISYIEKLLQTKITDGKKRIFALVLCPYLVNIRKLTLEECEKILIEYFDNSISRSIINYKLKEVYKKGILPYSLKRMQDNDPELYQIIQEAIN